MLGLESEILMRWTEEHLTVCFVVSNATSSQKKIGQDNLSPDLDPVLIVITRHQRLQFIPPSKPRWSILDIRR